MKVLIIGQSVERSKGGIATVIQGMLDAKADAYGYQYEHLVTHVEGSLLERILIFAKATWKLILADNVALAHLHTACDGSFFRKAILSLICRVKKVPTVMHVHGADFHEFYNKSIKPVKSFIRSTMKNCDRVVVLSKYWKDFFEETLNINNVEVIFNAVNSDAFSDCITVPQNSNKFLFLGRLGERKGVYDLIKAIDMLVNTGGMNELKFYLAGDGEIEEVKQLVNQLNLTNNVEVLGWVGSDAKAGLFKKVDTVVLPSYNEGLPVALLEAMAAGKVILSTPVGGIPDLVVENVNGFLVQPGDVQAIASRIKHIATNPQLITAIGKANQQTIRKDYNSFDINEQVFELYTRILVKHFRAFS